MDKSIHYSQVKIANFDSAYNVPLKSSQKPPIYNPMSSSIYFSTFSNRSSSPLFRRSVSPPSRPPISTRPAPKFNFDLYKMDENNNEYDGYSSPTYRSLSPSSHRIIHHRSIHSPPLSPTSKTQPLSKLRQINDELCYTLAQSELTDPLQQSPPHYHIHHYPLSQHSHQKHRSRSRSDEHSPPTKLERSPKIRKARVTYKIHIPRQHRKTPRRMSTSDVYSPDDPIIVDLYPTRDQGFVKQRRKHSDNQSPWIVDGTSLRRSSYSDTSTSQSPETPKGPYYGDKPIKPHHRSVRGKERPSSSSHHQSSHVTSRSRPDTAPFSASDPHRESNDSFSNTAPVWRSSSSIKRSKFNGSHAPPSSKTRESVWYPPSKTTSERSPKYFKPIIKSEHDVSTGKRIVDGTESEPVLQQETLSNRTKIRSNDPKLKKPITNAESNVKSDWEPTVTGLTQSTVKQPKSPVPHPVKKPTTTVTTPPKSEIKSVPSEPTAPIKKVITAPPTTTNTDRSSADDIPRKPMFESTPRTQSIVNKNDDSVENLFENESHTSEPSRKQELPRPPPQVEKIPTPPPPPKLPAAERKVPSPKPNNKDNESADDDDDENDEEVARSFDINNWLSNASKAILNPSKTDNIINPSTAPRPPPKTNPRSPPPPPKSPPRRKQQPQSPESPDHNLYKPPFGPKKKDQKAATPPPATTTTGDANDVDDFFS